MHQHTAHIQVNQITAGAEDDVQHPGVRQVDGVRHSREGPPGGPAEQTAADAAIFGQAQPENGGEHHRPEGAVEGEEHGGVVVLSGDAVQVRCGTVQHRQIQQQHCGPASVLWRPLQLQVGVSVGEEVAKEEATEVDDGVVPRSEVKLQPLAGVVKVIAVVAVVSSNRLAN